MNKNFSKTGMLLPEARSRINLALNKLGRAYYESIPMDTIRTIIRLSLGLHVLQANGEVWSGRLGGEEGKVHFLIGHPKGVQPKYTIPNSLLIVYWYRMNSGRYEINTYLT